MNPSEIQKKKTLMRLDLRRDLRSLPRRDRIRKNQVIYKRVIGSGLFKKSEHLLIYVSTAYEVDTKKIIERALLEGKAVYVPAPARQARAMNIYRIRNYSSDLRSGRFGILEPLKRRGAKGNPAVLDLILVPGLGFDRRGGRLGRGAGYFDAFLPQAQKAALMGLAYKEQIRRTIPMEAHDIFLHAVITD